MLDLILIILFITIKPSRNDMIQVVNAWTIN